jgi:hypothetical protein
MSRAAPLSQTLHQPRLRKLELRVCVQERSLCGVESPLLATQGEHQKHVGIGRHA